MAGYVIYSLDWGKFQALVERPTPDQLSVMARFLAEDLEGQEEEFDAGDPFLKWFTDPRGLDRIVAERLAMPDWYGDLSAPGKSFWEHLIFNTCTDGKAIDVGFRADHDGVSWDVVERAWKHLGVVPGQVSNVAFSAFGQRPFRYQAPRGPAKTREQHDKEEADRLSSLAALGGLLGDFLKAAKQGQADPDALLKKLGQNEGVSESHKKAIKGVLGDDDSEDEEDTDDEAWQPMHSMHTPDEVRKMLEELRSLDAPMKKAKKEVRRQFEEDLFPAIRRVADEGRMLFIQVDT